MDYKKIVKNLRAHPLLWDGTPEQSKKVERLLSEAKSRAQNKSNRVVKQFKNHEHDVENHLVGNVWYTISQQKKSNGGWQTEINGKLVVKGSCDVLHKTEGKQAALKRIYQ